MGIPSVIVYIKPGAAALWQDVSGTTDIESSLELTESLEAPAETNRFVAPDVQLKIHEGSASEFQRAWLANIQPESLDYEVAITVSGAYIFHGFILPNTLQFDDVERWAAFTAFGMAGKLARVAADAATSLKRPTSTGWKVKRTNGNSWRAEVEIEKLSAQSTCEFVTDDMIALDTGGGSSLEVKVVGVRGVGTSAPFASFMLTVEGLNQQVAAGATVTLTTPYLRNVDMQTVVNALFNAAGLYAPSSGNYNVLPISGASAPFATAPNRNGLTGFPLSVIPNVALNPMYHPVIGTTTGSFIQYDPPLGAWAEAVGYPQTTQVELVDWTDSGTFSSMGYMVAGPRFEQYAVTPTDPESDYAYVFWHYWINSSVWTPPIIRFGIIVTVGNVTGTMADFSFSVSIARDSSADGRTWTRTHTVSVPTSGTTKQNLHTFIGDVCGVTTTGTTASRGKVLFTYPIGGEVSEYAIGYANIADLTGRTEWLVGPRGRCHLGTVWQIDSMDNSEPKAYRLALTEFGVPVSILSTRTLPAGFQPHTMTYNPGDGYWYALAGTNENGVLLLSYANVGLDPRPGYVPAQIEAPGTVWTSVFDLTCVRTPTLPPSTWPMVALCNGNVWWIAYSFSGLIPYVDIEGLSCGDALAELATLVGGFPYVDANLASHFRSRAATAASSIITGTSGTSTRLDDSGCQSLRRASVWYKALRYVKVISERDEAVFGVAGDVNFRGTEQGLELTLRFVTTTSFAAALAQHLLSYLGRRLTLVDIEHELDERRFEVGRTFTASILGVVKTFQVIDVTARPTAGTARVQGIEM